MRTLQPSLPSSKNGNSNHAPTGKPQTLPPATAGVSPNRASLLNSLYDAISKGDHGFEIVGIETVGYENELYKRVLKLSDSTVDAYCKEISGHSGRGVSKMLIGVLHAQSSDGKARYLLEIMKMGDFPSSFPNEEGLNLLMESTKIYLGLNSYKEINYVPPGSITNEDDPGAKSVMALAKATIEISRSSDRFIFRDVGRGGILAKLKNDDLASYILEHPSDCERIITAVIGRDTDDVATIQRVLENGTPSLMNGVL